MRVIPTSRRTGRINPGPQAGAAIPRLVARQWWFGGPASDAVDLSYTPAIPPGARWCDVRAIGPGGPARRQPEDSSVAWSGSGGCYARRLSPVRPGQLLELLLGVPKVHGDAATPQPAAASLDGVVICRAAGGVSATVGAHAPAPLASACIGDVIRPGGPGGVSAYTGGRPGGDLGDPDSLRLGGVSRQGADLARPAELGNQPVFADYGAGGVAGLNTAGSNAWWPQPPSGGNNAHGGASVIVLEFYDRRPY